MTTPSETPSDELERLRKLRERFVAEIERKQKTIATLHEQIAGIEMVMEIVSRLPDD